MVHNWSMKRKFKQNIKLSDYSCSPHKTCGQIWYLTPSFARLWSSRYANRGFKSHSFNIMRMWGSYWTSVTSGRACRAYGFCNWKSESSCWTQARNCAARLAVHASQLAIKGCTYVYVSTDYTGHIMGVDTSKMSVSNRNLWLQQEESEESVFSLLFILVSPALKEES